MAKADQSRLEYRMKPILILEPVWIEDRMFLTDLAAEVGEKYKERAEEIMVLLERLVEDRRNPPVERRVESLSNRSVRG